MREALTIETVTSAATPIQTKVAEIHENFIRFVPANSDLSLKNRIRA